MAKYVVRHTFFIDGKAYLPYESLDTDQIVDMNVNLIDNLVEQGSIELIITFQGEIFPEGQHIIEGTGAISAEGVKSEDHS
jgi:hypothetical protein